MKKNLTILLLLSLISHLGYSQFLHQKGKYVVDGNGNEVLLRGIGMGGWMLQEGYMMETSAFANTQHQLKAKIADLVGEEGMNEFYRAWLTNYCQKEDVDSLAAWGFNSIRLPLHYNLFTLPIEQEPVPGQDTWLTQGFELVDSLLKWCSANQMYLILDLHAAPGGQGSDAAISDYDNTKPSLWESAENRRKTVALWARLAERYASEPWIGGYDLLNETNWTMTNNSPLKTLYNDITKAIRSVDKNHLLFIEGNWFANDFTGLTPPWDTNMAYSFHKYWSYNDQASIQWVLNLRNQYNVPLWLGESGENSNPWFTAAINLVERNKIGWAWWPYKKIGSVTGTVTIPKTSGYQTLLNYWKNGGIKPSAETAKAYLMEQAEQLKLQHCIVRHDVLDAMFRQAQGDKTPRPFKQHQIPGTVFASEYDLGGNGYAYFDVDSADFHVSTDVYTAWNSGYAFRNDAVDLEACTDAVGTNGYNVGWTNDKEWLLYSVDIDSTALYEFELRYAASGSAGKFHLELDGTEITTITSLAASGGWTSWKSLTLKDIILKKGRHQLKLFIDKAGFNVNYLKFANPKELANVEPRILTTKTDQTGNLIYLVSNLVFDSSSVPQNQDFTLTINGDAVALDTLHFSPTSGYSLTLEFSQQLKSTDNILLSYHGTTLKTDAGTLFGSWQNVKVANNSPVYVSIPGTIQAENFSVNHGLSSETCTDTGGGLDMGYTHSGDYLDYLVYVPYNGIFTVEYRVASTKGGTIELRLADDPSAPVTLQTVTVPNTGGWQTWKTVSGSANLSKGTHTLRLYIKQPEFNINWFKVSLLTGIESIGQAKKLEIYPNPAVSQIYCKTGNLTGKYQIKITTVQGKLVRQVPVDLNSGKIIRTDISGLENGIYLLVLEGDSELYFSKFIKLNP